MRIQAVSDPVILASAQLAIAREYGFESWPKLKRSYAPDACGWLSSCSALPAAASASPRESALPSLVPAGPNADHRKPPSGSCSTE